MKRIGLVTLYENNYGSALQCYATKTYIERHGIGCDLLVRDARGSKRHLLSLSNHARNLSYCLRYPGFAANQIELRKAASSAHRGISPASQKALGLFSDAVLQPKECDYKLLKDVRMQSSYDYFIAGSDQIWNGSCVGDPFQFLEFAPNDKKVALSASFGTSDIKGFNRNYFSQQISGFSHLSAREYAGVRIIKDLTGRDAIRLADPVTLLTPEEWSSFAGKGHSEKGSGYILLHFIDHPSEATVNVINELATETKLPLRCFAYPHREFANLPGMQQIDGGPRDYVSLIRDSEYVLSDSFHTAEFSIIFNKEFYIFHRNYQHSNGQGSRFDTLLDIYSCKDRLIPDGVASTSLLPKSPRSFDSVRSSEQARLSNYLDQFLTTPCDAGSLLKDASDCTGCMACMAICPRNAIHVTYSAIGTRLPAIDAEACVNCQLCKRVCEHTVQRDIKKPEAYIAFSNDCEIQSTAASGGVFASLATSLLSRGGAVAGSALSFIHGVPLVQHRLINSPDSLVTLLGSKYVESDCTDIYEQVSKQLKLGIPVLFCGTSCQVASLLSFLAVKAVDQTNLCTIDLVCHGVPGSKLFSDYISWLSKRISRSTEEITDFKFRKKESGKIEYSESVYLSGMNGDREVGISSSNSSYYEMFLEYESYRDACYHCQYASLNKPSDITIGDYFEAQADYPDLFQPGSALRNATYINCAIVHTDKGLRFLHEYGDKLTLVEADEEVIQRSHRQLKTPPSFSFLRMRAIAAYTSNGFAGINSLCRHEFRKEKLIHSVLLPAKFVRKLFLR